MASSRSRYIPKQVVLELRNTARDRCCLGGHLIPIEELNEGLESETLHMHHIVYFSAEGESTEGNLMLVCPMCHDKIHRRPDLYPHERLKEAKRHWIAMRDLVPMELDFESDDEDFIPGPHALVPFRVEAFNLDYLIRVPEQLPISSLARFIANWIMRPLVFYARTAPYKSVLARAHIGRIRLALKSDPEHTLEDGQLVKEIPKLPNDALIALADMRMVAALRMEQQERPDAVETITLKWGSSPTDLDLHFFVSSEGNTAHVFYRNFGTLDEFPWAKLNEDIRQGFGPEEVTFGMLARGRYRIAVHNYSREAPLAGCGAVVEAKIGNRERTFECPMTGHGDWWVVFDLDVERLQIHEINKLTEDVEGN